MTVPEHWLAGPVSRETLADLEQFAERFRSFAEHTNLVSRSTLGDLWSRHIADSAQLHFLKPEAMRWLDLGSGGGFPGLVTAILLKDKLGAHIDLVESTGKKAAFLRATVEALALPAKIWSERIEGLPGKAPEPEFVSARALAPLPRLLALAEPWLTHGAAGLFHKGRSFRAEVEESFGQWRFDMVEHKSFTDSASVILEIRELRRKKPAR